MTQTIMTSALMALAGTALIAALWRLWTVGRPRRARMAALLDPSRPLFDPCEISLTESGFPRLAGRHGGHSFDVQLVNDTLNMRKLPTLWLLVTLRTPLPGIATFDMMMRPRGIEYFSRFRDLAVQVTPEAGFPEDVAIRTDDPQRMPPQEIIRHHLALFDDGRAKELVISPNGLRIVWLVEEANRGRYLIFRDSDMSQAQVLPRDVQMLMDYLIGLRDDLTRNSDQP